MIIAMFVFAVLLLLLVVSVIGIFEHNSDVTLVVCGLALSVLAIVNFALGA